MLWPLALKAWLGQALVLGSENHNFVPEDKGKGPFQKKRLLSTTPKSSLSTDFEQVVLIAIPKGGAYTRGGAGINPS